MASWLHTPPDSSAENLTERLARTRDLAGPARAGDTYGQAGRQRPPIDETPPPLPSAWLTLIPYLVLLIVAVALTVGLIVIGAQS